MELIEFEATRSVRGESVHCEGGGDSSSSPRGHRQVVFTRSSGPQPRDGKGRTGRVRF